MTALDERLVRILSAIVESYDRQPPERRSRLTHHRTMDYERFLEWDDSMPTVTRDDIDELHDLGWIDLDYAGSGDYLVRPTADGRRNLRTYQREKARSERRPQQAVDLSWPAVRPVLHAVVDLWTAAGAPLGGYVAMRSIAERLSVPPDDLATARAIEALARNDWLDASYDDETDELEAMPTMRGLAARRGWPGGDPEVAAERLLATLDEVAELAADDDTRGWATRARDTLMEVGTKTLAEVVSKSVGNAM